MAGPVRMQEQELTYDALRRVERQENSSPRLTQLEAAFWERLGEHLNRLRQEFQAQQEEDPTARRTVVLADELRNTQRLAEGIWSLREKKVVQAALGAVRRREGKASVPEHATREERDLFASVMEVMQAARDEAAITDPFSKRRRDRLEAAAAKAEGTRTRASSEGGQADDGTGVTTTNRPGGHEAPGASPKPAAAAGGGEGPPAVAPHAQDAGGQGDGRTGGGEAHQRVVAEEGAQAGGEKEGSGEDPGRGASGVGVGVRGGPGTGEEDGKEIRQEGEKGEKTQADKGRGGVGAPGQQEVELRLVRALKEVPLFAGPDLVTYELGAGEVGTLPAKAAQILEQRGIVRVLPAE